MFGVDHGQEERGAGERRPGRAGRGRRCRADARGRRRGAVRMGSGALSPLLLLSTAERAIAASAPDAASEPVRPGRARAPIIRRTRRNDRQAVAARRRTVGWPRRVAGPSQRAPDRPRSRPRPPPARAAAPSPGRRRRAPGAPVASETAIMTANAIGTAQAAGWASSAPSQPPAGAGDDRDEHRGGGEQRRRRPVRPARPASVSRGHQMPSTQQRAERGGRDRERQADDGRQAEVLAAAG